MKNHTSKTGFTLIEMLVVIAIIALLAGLLFPAITAAMQTSYRRRAAVTCQSIESAIMMYMNDYNGRFPVPTDLYGSDKEFDSTTTPKSNAIFRVLMGENVDDLNPGKKVYLSTEVPSDDGTVLDPWGTQYRIILDLSMDGKITYPTNASQAHRKKAVVVSAGKKTGNKDEPEFGDGNDIANVELNQ